MTFFSARLGVPKPSSANLLLLVFKVDQEENNRMTMQGTIHFSNRGELRSLTFRKNFAPFLQIAEEGFKLFWA